AADQIRAGAQPEDRQGARYHHSAGVPGYRRPGDRVNTRRDFLRAGAAGLYIAILPTDAGAQQAKIYRIGFLGAASASSEVSVSRVEALRSGLKNLGHTEGKNLVIDFRWAEGKYERLPGLAAELVRGKVDVIVTYGTPGTRAAMEATTTIPIVVAG